MIRGSTSFGTLLILVSACQPTAGSLSDQDRQANQAITDAFVQHLLAKDFDALAALYADDGVLMPPNQAAAVGRDAIRQFAASFPPVTEFRATNDVIEGRGDIAYVRGRYALRFAMQGTPTDSGKYLEIRRRQPDGSWKITIDIFNSSVPAPSPATSGSSGSR